MHLFAWRRRAARRFDGQKGNARGGGGGKIGDERDGSPPSVRTHGSQRRVVMASFESVDAISFCTDKKLLQMYWYDYTAATMERWILLNESFSCLTASSTLIPELIFSTAFSLSLFRGWPYWIRSICCLKLFSIVLLSLSAAGYALRWLLDTL